MIQTIKNCYDSHTHFLATGQVACELQLQDLKSAEDIKQISLLPKHYRGDWIVGFGWDENKWNQPQKPNKNILDQVFPNTPVFFSRVDGHSSWINTKAIETLTQLGYDFDKKFSAGFVERDSAGQLTGILVDQAHIEALFKLPKHSDEQVKLFAQTAQHLFHQAGFTHVRDMSMNAQSWNVLARMSEQQDLKLCIDSFVTSEDVNDLDRVVQEVKQLKDQPCFHLRVHGIKIFVDGSLGSKTAALSENYLNTNSSGLMMWGFSDIKAAIQKAWVNNLEIAVHVIGDRAIHEVVTAAREVAASGILGRLHLEHVQILNPKTVQLMKPLHITCHMQPVHWLSDHSWLSRSISESLMKNLFQWELIRKNNIPLFFGSDSPIEPTSLINSYKALSLSQKHLIPALNADWTQFHSHPDKNWSNSRTEFDSEKIHQVYFNNEPLLSIKTAN